MTDSVSEAPRKWSNVCFIILKKLEKVEKLPGQRSSEPERTCTFLLYTVLKHKQFQHLKAMFDHSQPNLILRQWTLLVITQNSY